jgi:hypothetical protein
LDYSEFLDERKANMYLIIESSENPCLEGFKKRQKEEGEKAAKSFLNFLKKNHPEKAKECEKKPNKLKALIEQRTKEYKEWAKAHPKLNAALLLFAAGSTVTSAQHINNQNNHIMAMQMHNQAHYMNTGVLM